MKILIGLMVGLICNCYVNAQQNALNVPLMHQLIENNKTEIKKQEEVKIQQARNTAVEAGNRFLITSVKDKYQILQKRFSKMGLLFDVANIGITATPLVQEIIQSQQKIISLAEDDPILIPIALDTELVFVQKARSLINYVIGLSAVIGDLNQMKLVDRRILFDHILNELRTISYLSGGVVRIMIAQKLKKSNLNPFADYVNREDALVNAILNNIKILKQ